MQVYLDNAASTRLHDEVLNEMLPYFTQKFGNPSSIHAFGRQTKAAVERARKIVAGYLNASTAEIIFTSGGTESNNTAIKCAVRDLGVQRIISSPTEHHCVLHTVEAMARAGVEVVWLNVDAEGVVDLNRLEQLLQSNQVNTLVTLMHGNNEIGTIAQIELVAEICAKHGAYFHTDTVQTVAHYPFDLQKLGVHFMSGSAHKFHGPKGTGFLFVRSGVPVKPFIDGGSQERNMRAGTENVAGIVGLGKALEISISNLQEDRAHIVQLKDYMQKRLSEMFKEVQFNGSQANSLYTVLSVSFPPHPKNELLLFNLDISGIAASGGSACTSGTEKASHVLEAINAHPDRKTIRFSFSKYTTIAEVDYTIEALAKIHPELLRNFASA